MKKHWQSTDDLSIGNGTAQYRRPSDAQSETSARKRTGCPPLPGNRAARPENNLEKRRRIQSESRLVH